ncbi:response regulator [Chroococcidiopsis sp. FACHB-1243]|uniref:response regulator n=1 Tax=Chroococcidiopsis sp. [FACHB-1243] TaxID=2692781 RepID=UPI001783A956|nr:response regulator [Chroococcidiopsis sp. [FACHB-1243]]MBD2307332.1 response regulator [Chroococcidiopsis sp. [FACHB-1243]]
MSDENFRGYIQLIHQQMAVLHSYITHLSPLPQKQVAQVIEEITAALGNLQLIYEEMETSLEASALVEEELCRQNQQAMQEHQHYYDLFQSSPDAYLVTDANGLILEANRAIATLLNVPQSYLPGKPLAIYITQSDRQTFRTRLNQLPLVSGVQNWEMNLCPRHGKPFAAGLKVAVVRDNSGFVEALRIGVHDISEYKQVVTQPAFALNSEDMPAQVTTPMPSLPQALDGLQVLVVDDEADVREFITAVLESQGIRVTAVESAAAALEALERFHPDVLICDIRMPDRDGYSLIRQVRELEAQQGWHIPAAALTAYLAEAREKAIAAGFESHLHKLAQPTQIIEMVTQLSRRSPT